MKFPVVKNLFRVPKRYFNSIQSPLNILFFGSDEFSIHSLRALNIIRLQEPSLLTRLQVVTRPAKSCGRYLSHLRDVPIVRASEEMGLSPVIRCDSSKDMLSHFLGSKEYNMIIAVSFGKLIPGKLISQMSYSLNVHPSLLPKYKGSSPIQYALLNNDKVTGVSVQTLHPSKFDHGEIVAQSSPMEIRQLLMKGTVSQFEENTPHKVSVMMDQLGLIGAELLTKVIKERLYTSQIKKSPYEESYAPKITTEMRRIHWQHDKGEDIVNRLEVLGPVFSFKETMPKKKKDKQLKRIIFTGLELCGKEYGLCQAGEFAYMEGEKCIVIRCADGKYLRCKGIQFEGFKEENCHQFMTSLGKRCGKLA